MNQPTLPQGSLPTGDVHECVDVNFDIDGEVATLIFADEKKAGFAIKCKPPLLPAICAMVNNLIAQWHSAKPELGLFYHKTLEASVHSSDMMRGSVLVSFDKGIGYSMTNETGLALAELLNKHIMGNMTEDERAEYLQKKAPMIVQPRKKLILPQ